MAHSDFREKNFGIVDYPSNSHKATDNYYVDRSRLKTKDVEEWNPGIVGNGYTKRVETASIMDNARRAAGEMGVRGSFRNETDSPEGYSWRPRNPIVRDRGDD